MFGYININKGELKVKEFERYRAYYCGLCHALQARHGLPARLTLNYDMTFAVMLLSDLYDAEGTPKMSRCLVHPAQPHMTIQTPFSDYCADMNVLLAYYKCRDDWKDEQKADRLIYSGLLTPAYEKIKKQYPEKSACIAGCLKKLARAEEENCRDIDYVSGLFGRIMAAVFACRQDEWTKTLRRMGYHLGRFIYLLDAYEDLEKDKKEGNYNPLIPKSTEKDFEKSCETLLIMTMSECCRQFERLPLLENVDILRNILYSGVWYTYEKTKETRKKGKIEKND